MSSYSGGGIVSSAGSWTPTLGVISGTDGTHTYSIQAGDYLKMGRLVWFTCRIVLTAKDAAMSGNAAIKGLPFTASTFVGGSSPTNIGNLSNIDLTAGYSQFIGFITTATSQIELRQVGDNVSVAALAAAAFASNTQIVLGGSYMTDS